MQLNEVLKRIPHYLDAGVTVEVTGQSGIGKSEGIMQLKQTLEKRDGHEWGVSTQFPIFYNPSDIAGYLGLGEQMIVNEKQEEVLAQVSIFSQPPWMVADCGRQLNSFRRGFVLF